MAVNPRTAESLTDKDVAELLARDQPIHLPALRYLGPGIARKLATSSHGIVLRSLPAITVAAAEALASHKWGLHLTGVVSVSRDLGDALAKHVGPVEFGDTLKELHSPQLARKIAEQSEGVVKLNGLETISPEIARNLVYRTTPNYEVASVSLNGLRALSAEAAAELVELYPVIFLEGLSTGNCILGEGAEDTLSARSSPILMVGEDIAGFMSQPYSLELLAAVIGSMNRLSNYSRTYLDLDDLTALTPIQATAITAFRGTSAGLSGLRTVTDEVAEILSKCKFDLCFDDNLILSPAARAALRAKFGDNDDDDDDDDDGGRPNRPPPLRDFL